MYSHCCAAAPTIHLQNFLPSEWKLSTLTVSFEIQDALFPRHLIRLFFLWLSVLQVPCLRKFRLTQDHEDLPLCLLLRVLIALALIFRSLINFGRWHEEGLQPPSFVCEYSVVPAPFLPGILCFYLLNLANTVTGLATRAKHEACSIFGISGLSFPGRCYPIFPSQVN